MRIFQASLALPVLKRHYQIFNEPLNVLLSVPLVGKDMKLFLIEYRHMSDRIIADSGAWSVAKGNSNFTIEQLIPRLKRWEGKLFLYFNLDTDFSDHGFNNNYANQLRMEKEGLHPVPVIHNFFNEEIDFYVESGKYPWLALGSSQSTNYADFKYAIDRIKWKDPNIRIHWFGGSKFEWLVNTPVASCDTSSWAKAGGFGNVYYWNAHKEGLNRTDRIYVGGYMNDEDDGTYHFVTYKWRYEVEKYLRETFGFEYADLCGYNDKFNMQLVNARFYAELERRVNEERIKRGIPLE
jgi:hypothetical protein